MLKYVAPLEQKLRHMQRPPAFRHHTAEGSLTASQLLAERAAALIGSWRFLIIQACLLASWVLLNALRIVGFDPMPFILLNLMLSFQAAFTGPILLIAANVGALRDHSQYDRMEAMEQNLLAENAALTALLVQVLAKVDKPAPKKRATVKQQIAE